MSQSSQHSEERSVGIRSPFDDYPKEEDEKKRLKAFLERTGLHDYERFIRIGAFLARREPGTPQIKYMKKIRRQEDAARSNYREEDTAPQGSIYGLKETAEDKKKREAYEDYILNREGCTGKWNIFFQQSRHVLALVGCCSLGAVIQGWDETAINGAQLTYPYALNMTESPGTPSVVNKSPGKVGVINAAPYLMCIFSCFLTGPLNHYLGRRGTIMFCCVFSFASCLGQAFCQSWQQLLVCRLLLGLGIGPKSATIPIYAAESMPSEEIRGALVMTWQLCTAFGIMLGYIFTYTFQNLRYSWRFMVGSPMLAPAILFFLMIALPESPRWHLLKARRLESHRYPDRLQIRGHYDKAFHALRRLRYLKLQAARDLYTIDIWLRMDSPQLANAEAHQGRESRWFRVEAWFPNIITLVKDPRCLRAMRSGLIVLSLQQLCGVNVFAYYSNPVFKDSLAFDPTCIDPKNNETIISSCMKQNHDADHSALAYSLGFGGINFGLAIVGLFLIDSVGRRLLLVLTFPLMSAFQFGTAFSFGKSVTHVDRWRHAPVVVFAYLFCAVYSIGEGPVPVVYASEILPLEVRDTGVGILSGIYWGLNSLMALTWPLLYKAANPEGSFCFYGALNLIGWILIILFVPETSRYKLEEVDKVFRFTTGQIMRNGCDQMKWLLGKKGRKSRRWEIDQYPVLVPRSNDTPFQVRERELDDYGASTSTDSAMSIDNQAINGHVARTITIRDV